VVSGKNEKRSSIHKNLMSTLERMIGVIWHRIRQFGFSGCTNEVAIGETPMDLSKSMSSCNTDLIEP
jgi:hypothetical protein